MAAAPPIRLLLPSLRGSAVLPPGWSRAQGLNAIALLAGRGLTLRPQAWAGVSQTQLWRRLCWVYSLPRTRRPDAPLCSQGPGSGERPGSTSRYRARRAAWECGRRSRLLRQRTHARHPPVLRALPPPRRRRALPACWRGPAHAQGCWLRWGHRGLRSGHV
jgi:hypothetical protein